MMFQYIRIECGNVMIKMKPKVELIGYTRDRTGDLSHLHSTCEAKIIPLDHAPVFCVVEMVTLTLSHIPSLAPWIYCSKSTIC